MTSPAVVVTESLSGAKQIQVIFKGLKQLPTLRKAIQARVISPLDALGFYSQGLTATTKLFLIQTESVVPTDQLGPAVGLIDTVQAREELYAGAGAARRDAGGPEDDAGRSRGAHEHGRGEAGQPERRG